MSGLCSICTRDSQTAACPSCVDQLVADLGTLVWLAGELEVTRTRQARVAGAGGRRDPADAAPIGFHIGAALAAADLHHLLHSWVERRFPPRPPLAWPADTPVHLAAWIAAHRTQLHRLPDVDRLADELHHHTEHALEIINPPDPDEQCFGLCWAELIDEHTVCQAYLYGPPGAAWVRCRRCRTQHDTSRRIDQLRRRMDSMYFRAATLARLLPRLLERPVSASNIRNWHADGRPIRTLADEEGWPTYRTGDVIKVAIATPKRNRLSNAS